MHRLLTLKQEVEAAERNRIRLCPSHSVRPPLVFLQLPTLPTFSLSHFDIYTCSLKSYSLCLFTADLRLMLNVEVTFYPVNDTGMVKLCLWKLWKLFFFCLSFWGTVALIMLHCCLHVCSISDGYFWDMGKIFHIALFVTHLLSLTLLPASTSAQCPLLTPPLNTQRLSLIPHDDSEQ